MHSPRDPAMTRNDPSTVTLQNRPCLLRQSGYRQSHPFHNGVSKSLMSREKKRSRYNGVRLVVSALIGFIINWYRDQVGRVRKYFLGNMEGALGLLSWAME